MQMHMKVISDHRSEFPIEAIGMKKTEKKKTFFLQASSFQLLKLEIHCDDHLSLSYLFIFVYMSKASYE